MRNQVEFQKLKDAIVRMALYDGNEVKPNVFKPLSMADIGRALASHPRICATGS